MESRVSVYGIAVGDGITEGAFLRLDSIPSCNGFHTMLCIDSIHASRRDLVREFKSIRKYLKTYFLFALHIKDSVEPRVQLSPLLLWLGMVQVRPLCVATQHKYGAQARQEPLSASRGPQNEE